MTSSKGQQSGTPPSGNSPSGGASSSTAPASGAASGNSPSSNAPSGKTHSQRRQGGGARREASERVQIRASGFESSGWTLNISRGGLRAVFEDALDPEVEYEVCVGDEPARKARLAWARAEADGQIVGLRFLDVDGSVPPEEAH